RKKTDSQRFHYLYLKFSHNTEEKMEEFLAPDEHTNHEQPPMKHQHNFFWIPMQVSFTFTVGPDRPVDILKAINLDDLKAFLRANGITLNPIEDPGQDPAGIYQFPVPQKKSSGPDKEEPPDPDMQFLQLSADQFVVTFFQFESTPEAA